MAQFLHDLIREAGLKTPVGLVNPLIEKITCDSRCIYPGSLFLGLPGEQVDGGFFWRQALASGAAAAIIGPLAASAKPPGLGDPVFVAPEPVGKFVGELLSVFWGRPSSKISLIGVTGTNGKTTTTHLIDYLSASVGIGSALFGTLINRWPGHQEVAAYTTGFADSLQENLSKAVEAGVEIAAMEVSSHSLVQHRVGGCQFSGAIFTNLTQDHLDYHDSMKKYFEAKTLLFKPPYFQMLPGTAVVNIDNNWGLQLAEILQEACWKCSLDEQQKDNAELFISDIEITSRGLKGCLFTPVGKGHFISPLVGQFNLMNLLQAVGVLIQQGLPLQELLTAIVDFPGVPGRMERIRLDDVGNNSTLPTVFVDYAHTPDGLMNALIELRPFTTGKLICVFGCGGDRDREKRCKMGAIASKFSDQLLVTSDNPRTEDPQKIINDIVEGISSDSQWVVEADRAKAIEIAISSACYEDLVLIAGKGHEDYQILGNEKIYFDDRVVAQKFLRDKKNKFQELL